MAQEYEQLNNRQKQRQQAQWYRQQARKRAKRLRIAGFVAILAVCVLVIGVVIHRSVQPSDGTTAPQLSATTLPSGTTSVPEATQPPAPTEPETVITLVAGGDVNATDKAIASGESNGRYDYTAAFMDIAPILSGADAAFVNFEGNLYGAPYGTATSSAPQELLEALAGAGVDFVQMANSCSINNGMIGLRTTLDRIRQAGMEPVGAFASNAEFAEKQGFTIHNIGGIRVAVVAFTKGMNGLGLPEGSENCVNLLYTDYTSTYQEINTEGITAVLQAAQAQQPDVVIAMLHWGSEYNDNISNTQDKITKLMQENGVDAIIGTHSHYVQQIQYDAEAGTVVAYSLGDLFGDADKSGTNYSVLLQLQITRNNATGETRITACDYVPLYAHTGDDGSVRILRLEPAMGMYENNHVDRVPTAVYESMKYALQRIKARVRW